MKHINFTLKGEEMQIFEAFPFTIVTDCDGTELVYIRKQIHDDTQCDVIYVARCIYSYANWLTEDLERFVESYCLRLGRKIITTQCTDHLVHPSLDFSDFAYGVNGLRKLRG